MLSPSIVNMNVKIEELLLKPSSRLVETKTSTSNLFLCAADFFLQLGNCKEAVR